MTKTAHTPAMAALLAAACLAGCLSRNADTPDAAGDVGPAAAAPAATPQPARPVTIIDPDELLLAVVRHQGVSEEQAHDVAHCVRAGVTAAAPDQSVITTVEFDAAVDPIADPLRAPRQFGPSVSVSQVSDLRVRASALDVRYIAFLGGMRGVAPGGFADCEGRGRRDGEGACLWAMVWDKDARLGASILDLAESDAATNALPGLYLADLTLVPPADAPSTGDWMGDCAGVGTQIAQALAEMSG